MPSRLRDISVSRTIWGSFTGDSIRISQLIRRGGEGLHIGGIHDGDDGRDDQPCDPHGEGDERGCCDPDEEKFGASGEVGLGSVLSRVGLAMDCAAGDENVPAAV